MWALVCCVARMSGSRVGQRCVLPCSSDPGGLPSALVVRPISLTVCCHYNALLVLHFLHGTALCEVPQCCASSHSLGRGAPPPPAPSVQPSGACSCILLVHWIGLQPRGPVHAHSCWSQLREGWLETPCSNPALLSLSHLLCRSCSTGPLLPLRRSCSK